MAMLRDRRRMLTFCAKNKKQHQPENDLRQIDLDFLPGITLFHLQLVGD